MKSQRVTIAALNQRKKEGKKITVLTCYDYSLAQLINKAKIDIILVNDGAIGGIALGRKEGFSTTVEEVIYHTKAVKAGTDYCLVVSSLPFGSYNTVEHALNNATLLIKEGGADAVHIEGGRNLEQTVKKMSDSGIAVLGHIGLTKQIIALSGETKLQAREAPGILSLFKDAAALVEAGVFALILECIPESVAQIVTKSLPIPTIGLGAGLYCDGQALVTQDMLGLTSFSARFVKCYINLSEVIPRALLDFRKEVEESKFPTPQHTYHIKEEELSKVLAEKNKEIALY